MDAIDLTEEFIDFKEPETMSIIKIFTGNKIQYLGTYGLVDRIADAVEVESHNSAQWPDEKICDLVSSRVKTLMSSNEYPDGRNVAENGRWFYHWANFPKITTIIHFKDPGKMDWNNCNYKEVWYPGFKSDEEIIEWETRV